jgi:hypothetical protein
MNAKGRQDESSAIAAEDCLPQSVLRFAVDQADKKGVEHTSAPQRCNALQIL